MKLLICCEIFLRDGGELSCSNLDSDKDIRMGKSACKESEKSADEVNNIPVNPDIYVTRDGTECISHNSNVPGRFSTRSVLRQSSGPTSFEKHNVNLPVTEMERKTRHGVSFVPALLKTEQEDLRQHPVYQDSPKDTQSDLSLDIELVIPFAPNQDPQDIPQQFQLGEVVHYPPSE
ncbi:uncharacterized protein TNCV_4641101 [Trichonephila clavipes]|nr:uncharacterized protein TNCV_4641101 [Trichonephila clavipes]